MSKLKKLARGLRISTEVLSALEESGIDVDRLIGISNAQGPQAKIIKSILNHASGIDVDDLISHTADSRPTIARTRTKSSSRKRLAGKPG